MLMSNCIKILIAILSCLSMSLISYAKESEAIPEYELVGDGIGKQGTYLVKVTIITKKNNPNDNLLKLSAVHGILFRGFSNSKGNHQKPLTGGPASESQDIDFYRDFFSNKGSAKDFANLIDGSRSVVRSGKKYRVSATLSVNKDALRKYLEDAGVLKSLNSGF